MGLYTDKKGFIDTIRTFFSKKREVLDKAYFGSQHAADAETKQGLAGLDNFNRNRAVAPGMFPIGVGTFYEVFDNYTKISQVLHKRYVDYEEMDDYPDFVSALDTYSDEATQEDQFKKKTLWVYSDNKKIETIGNNCLKRLNIEDNIWAIIRMICKYGNHFSEVLVYNNDVVGLNHLAAPAVRVLADSRNSVYGYIFDETGKFDVRQEDIAKILFGQDPSRVYFERQKESSTRFYDAWEVVHWKLLGKHLNSIYGHGIGEGVRWLFRRLMMAEDSSLIYKLSRSSSRYIFTIPVGNLPPEKAMSYVDSVAQRYKRKKFYNPATGKFDMRNNPMNQQDDIWLGSYADGKKTTEIDVLQGIDSQNLNVVEYFSEKFWSAIKVPKSHVGFGGDSARQLLTMQDVRFAKAILRIQRAFKIGIKQILDVDLVAKNIDPNHASYDVNMASSSAIFELAKAEVLNARADLMEKLREYIPVSWLLQYIAGFSEEDVRKLMGDFMTEKRKREVWDGDTQNDILKGQTKAMEVGRVEVGQDYGIDPKQTLGGPYAMMQQGQQGQEGQQGEQGPVEWYRKRKSSPITESKPSFNEKEVRRKIQDLGKHDVSFLKKLKEVSIVLYEVRDMIASLNR